MEAKEFELLKSKFIKTFASVPMPLRKEIIAIIKDQPITWEVAYLEIQHNTQNAKNILQQLKEVGVLKDG